MIKNLQNMFKINFLITCSLFIPFEVIYFNHLGFSTIEITILTLSITFFCGIMEIPTGFLSDYYSRRTILKLSCFSFLISSVMLLVFENFGIILLAYLFEGIGWSFASGNNESIIKTNSQDSSFSKNLSKFYEKSFLALFISSVLAAFISFLVYDFQTAIIITIIFRLIAFMLAFTISESNTIVKSNAKYIYKEAFRVIKENYVLFIIEGFGKFNFFLPVVYQLILISTGRGNSFILILGFICFFISFLSQKYYIPIVPSKKKKEFLIGISILQAILILTIFIPNDLITIISTVLLYFIFPLKSQIISEYKHSYSLDSCRSTTISMFSMATNTISTVFYIIIGYLLTVSLALCSIVWFITLFIVTILSWLKLTSLDGKNV